MRKVLIGSAVILAFFFPVTASVAVADQPKPAPTAWPGTQGNDDDSDDDERDDEDEALEHRMHQELESRYGKHGSFQIPPLVLRPGPKDGQDPTALGTVGSEPVLLNPTIITPSSINGVVAEGVSVSIGTAVSGAEATGQGGVVGAQGVGAQGIGASSFAQTVVAAKPVDFALVQLNQQTPAQQFFNVATIALATLAAAAVALGATVGVRALREWRTERA